MIWFNLIVDWLFYLIDWLNDCFDWLFWLIYLIDLITPNWTFIWLWTGLIILRMIWDSLFMDNGCWSECDTTEITGKYNNAKCFREKATLAVEISGFMRGLSHFLHFFETLVNNNFRFGSNSVTEFGSLTCLFLCSIVVILLGSEMFGCSDFVCSTFLLFFWRVSSSLRKNVSAHIWSLFRWLMS